MDGLMHTVQRKLVSDPDGTTYVTTSYDGTGKPYQVSNPYHSTSDSTYGITTYTYDALGRTTNITHPDGAYATTSYAGRATSVQDEGNGSVSVQRISQVDGFGRLTSVCEVTNATQLGAGGTPAACGQDISKTGFLTSYSYDVLGNLLTVNQGSLGQRTFAYDGLSRLLCAANPETGSATCPNPDNGTYTAGTTRYGYDADGNLTSRTRPAPNQPSGAVTVAAAYQYDALNRLTQKSYSDGVTPKAQYGYDLTSITMGTQQFNIANSIGRLSWECTIAGNTCPTMNAFSYDPMGRAAQLWESRQHVDGINIVISYDYDLIGDELDYAFGATPPGNTKFVSTYNGAGSLTSFTTPTFVNSNNPANLLTGVHYDAFGHMISGNLANNLSLSWGYDSRGRVTAMAVGTTCASGNCSTNQYRFTTSYAPNSNIVSSTDTVNGSWTYTYDDLNRLSTGIANNGEGCSWDYDRYGNRWHQNAHSGSCPAPQYSFSGNNNRMDSYSYDAAGNLLNDGSHGYQYDAENRIVSVDGGATTYIYDAEGRRFSKTTGGITEATTYDREGRPLIRSNFAPREVYAAGMHLGTYIVNSAHTDTIFYYDHSDWLGTERARIDLSGTVCEKIASLPFGDNQTVTSTCGDLSPLHFTGKERDTESNLDNFGARYYGPSLGRFMTPDWAARPTTVPYARFGDPQTLNLYGYVENAAVNRVDADGHFDLGISGIVGNISGILDDPVKQIFEAMQTYTASQSGPAPDSTHRQRAQNACQSGSCNVKVTSDTGPTGTPNPFVAGVVQREVTYQAVDSSGKDVSGAEISLHETPLPGKEGGDAKSYSYASGKGTSNSEKGDEGAHRAGQFTDLMTTGGRGPAGFRQTYTVEGKPADIVWPTKNGPVIAPSQKVLDRPDKVIIIPEVSQ
jgi:RHS repeat-associated protein